MRFVGVAANASTARSRRSTRPGRRSAGRAGSTAGTRCDLPYIDGPGPNERYLDLRRYWSDDTIGALEGPGGGTQSKMRRIFRSPPTSWPTGAGPRASIIFARGIRFRPTARRASTRASRWARHSRLMMNKAGHDTPVWFNEFTAGGGGYYGTPGRSRMWAYFGADALRRRPSSPGRSTRISAARSRRCSAWSTMTTGRRGSSTSSGRSPANSGKLQKLGFPRYQKPEVAIALFVRDQLADHPAAGSEHDARNISRATTGTRRRRRSRRCSRTISTRR